MSIFFDLKDRLAAALDAKGLSQKELADSLGISSSAVSQYMSGSKKPKSENIEEIARILGVSPGWLEFGEGEGPKVDLEKQREKYSKVLGWKFRDAPIDGGRDFGNANIWAVPWDIDTLVRETIQNSQDAALNSDIGVEVVYTFIQLEGEELQQFLDTLQWRSDNGEIGLSDHIEQSSSNGHKLGNILSEGLQRLENQEKLILLRVDDYHTLGLLGPEEGGGKFVGLCRNNLDSDKESKFAGGSYGLGKAVLWRASRFSTVLFNSNLSEPLVEEGQERQMRRIIGKSDLAWHEINNQGYAGPGWFGEVAPVKGGFRAESIWENIALAHDLHLERPRKDPGTSILVMGFYDAASDEPDNLVRTAEELERAAAENFWPAIISNRLKVSIKIQKGRSEVYDLEVNPKEHVPELVDAYEKNQRHEIAEKLEEEGDVVRKIVTLTIPDREKPPVQDSVDHEAVLIVRRTSTDSENNNIVHFYRGRHMVVMEKNLGSLVFGGMPFKAFVECGLAAGDSDLHEKGEVFLRTAEPPAHDKWHLTSELKNDYALGSGARLKDFFNEIKTEIADLIKPTYEGDETGPKALSRLLKLSKPDRQTSVPKVRVDQDSSFVADDGGWMIEADIYLPENREWKMTPVLKFDAETGGGNRVSWVLEAVEKCSVDGGDLMIPEGVRTARFRGKSDPSTHPAPAEDTAVKVVLHRVRS